MVIPPDGPRIYTVPLDTAPTLTGQFHTQMLSTGIYPIELDNVIVSQRIELKEMILTTPIHVHTPTFHVGMIYGTSRGENVTALDAVMFLQQFSQTALDRNTFAQLLAGTVVDMKRAFMKRIGLNAAAIWDEYVAGSNVGNGPIGRDLLLGCTEVWGVECISFSLYSVVHLA
ncbi:hypothetical protein AN958_05125 [Leucoagaricus sp. SymC.cos]|nr:hypothetical protein AN958_05125 [Leucoagaricus sp. SymC.cos]